MDRPEVASEPSGTVRESLLRAKTETLYSRHILAH